MRAARPLVFTALLLASASCDVLRSDNWPLRIEGTVTSSATRRPIAGATVSVAYGNIFNGAHGELPDRVTDAQGRFSARIDEIRGYAEPNCVAVGVYAIAPGYHSNGKASLSGPDDDPTCQSGRATVAIELTPMQ